MSEKMRAFNIIAGIIIVGSAIYRLLTGSNNVPYFYIIAFIVLFLLQALNFHKSIKKIGLILTILLLITTIMTMLPRILPFGP